MSALDQARAELSALRAQRKALRVQITAATLKVASLAPLVATASSAPPVASSAPPVAPSASPVAAASSAPPVAAKSPVLSTGYGRRVVAAQREANISLGDTWLSHSGSVGRRLAEFTALTSERRALIANIWKGGSGTSVDVSVNGTWYKRWFKPSGVDTTGVTSLVMTEEASGQLSFLVINSDLLFHVVAHPEWSEEQIVSFIDEVVGQFWEYRRKRDKTGPKSVERIGSIIQVRWILQTTATANIIKGLIERGVGQPKLKRPKTGEDVASVARTVASMYV